MRPLSALFALLLALPASAGGFLNIGGKSIDEYTGTLTLRGWVFEQDSAVQNSHEFLRGTTIDFSKEGALVDDHSYVPEIDFELRFQELGFHLTGWRVSRGDQGHFTSAENFDRHTFNAFDPTYQRVTIGQIAAHFEWIPLDLGCSKEFGFELGFIVGARATRMEVGIRERLTDRKHNKDAIAVLPDIGLTVNVGFLNIFELEAQVSGFWLDVKNFDYQSINAGAELRVFFDEHFFIGLGYRVASGSIQKGKPKRDGLLIEYTYHGPSLSIGLRF